MLRRLSLTQPDSFAFTPKNLAWAEAQMTKFPEGRQASAIIPILWRAQEQEGWLTRPAIEYVADMLGLAYIRALEVASFYFMFQLQPVGSVANIQICGTTSCMICGAEDLIGMCQKKIAETPHTLSKDGKFSWEEVECLGACANAPMAQIGKDFYEDLTAKRLGEIIDELAAGKVPVPGPQNGRYAAEPLSGLTSLTDHESGRTQYNASVQLAVDLGETVKRIDGSEVPLLTPWLGKDKAPAERTKDRLEDPKPAKDKPISKNGITKQEANAKTKARPAPKAAAETGTQPERLSAARDTGADDLKKIKGVGPKLEKLLNSLGFYHYDQIANWSDDEVAWVDENLQGFKGRVSRDGWVEQAATLATGGETAFSRKVDKGGVY